MRASIRRLTGAIGTRQTVLIAALLAAVAVFALAAWGTTAWLNRSLPAGADRAELVALRTKLIAVRGAVDPIARSFTSEPPTAPVEVSAYEKRVAAAQKVVESVNDVEVSSSDALEVRDLILTGGSDVVAGMQAALQALKDNDSAAAESASGQVADGLTQLDQAQQRLDELLGTTASAGTDDTGRV